MFNFDYVAPTKVVFGKETEKRVGELLKEFNGKKILLHYGGGSVIRSGLLERVKSSMNEAGISYVELGGVVPNPRLSLVYDGIKLAKEEGVDFILAVGGGSTIDSAKAIGYGIANEGDVWDFYEGKRKAKACAPIGAVLTLAATGSEMSNSTVITKEDGWLKRGYRDDMARPKFAIMNPELTMTLPPYQTSCGCTDILMHTLERYFTHGGNMEMTDTIAEAVMRTVINKAGILMKDPNNYQARADIMWAGSLSHNGLTGCGTEGMDFATHNLEHEVGGIYDVAHGAGLAAIWGSWARYVMDNCLDRFKRFAIKVMDVPEEGTDEEIAIKGIESAEAFFKELNMPISLTELGINPDDETLRLMAHKCAEGCGGKKGVTKVLYEEDMYKILAMAL
ncbi:MAG: iron-containing alcohol dehydrogenase [Anaerovoracaceae bacterium]